MSVIKLLAERKVSVAVDAYYVYKAAILGEGGVPEGHRPYCDPQTFFSITYVTPAMRQYAEDVLRRLSRGESGVYLMPALLGAGKSHFLAFLLHIIALYSRCNGAGKCVARELEKYGIELETPDLAKLPEVYMFHGEHELGEREAELRRAKTKEELRHLLTTPFVIIFDETQHFEEREPGFPLWLQMLSEAVVDMGGVMLASFSLFSKEEADLRHYKSVDAISRVSPVKVVLDTVDNIVHVFRRWAGIGARDVDLSPLERAVDDKLLSEFRRKLSESYPFDPHVLDVVKKLAEESVVSETRVQLTRGLLWALAHAYVRATEEGAALATFRHLPKPEELLNVGGKFAADWKALVDLYNEDVKKVEEKPFAVSVLRHILLATFLSKFVRGELYPAEDDLVLGSFDGFAKPSDVRAFLLAGQGLHIHKLSNGRYLYWYVGDVYDVIFEAMKQYGEPDGLEEAVDAVVRILQERAGYFDAVYISGFGPPEKYEKRQRVYVVASKEEWEKRLRDNKLAILAVDLANFGVPERRNNLAVLRRNDLAQPPRSEVLNKLKIEPATVKEAVVTLGRFMKAAEDVLKNVYNYFRRELSEADEAFVGELAEILRNRVNGALKLAKSDLEALLQVWLGRAIVGFKEEELGPRKLEERLSDWHRRKEDLAREAVRRVMEKAQWDGFKKVGDLWSIYLNSPDLPFAPISFAKFVEVLKGQCGGCNCLFEVEGVVKWIGVRGCEMPEIDEDTGVAPVFVGGRLNTEVIEKFLRQLASDKTKRYKIVYVPPFGGERGMYADELLANPSEWHNLLNGARLEVEHVKRMITVKVDGIEDLKVEKPRGASATVEVEAGEDLEAVWYSIGGVGVREVSPAGGRAVFTVEVPEEPGNYVLSLGLRFKDGSEEHRTLTISVRGKCKRTEPAQVVEVGDLLKWIETSLPREASDLFDLLVKRGIDFVLNLKAQWREGEDFTEVRARLTPKSREKTVRLLKWLEMLSTPVEARFELKYPLPVDDGLKNDLRARKFVYGVEREVDC